MAKLEKVVKYGLFAALLTPLVYTRSTVYPFVFGKAIFFQIVIEITFFLWLILFLKDQERFRPQFGLLGRILFLFLGILVLSAIFGADFSRSWWSTAERADGVFFLLHCGAFFLMLSSFFKQKADWLWFLRGAVGVGALVSLYALAQKFQPQWEFLVPTGSQLQATLGNPSFLGSYLVFVLFLSLALIQRRTDDSPMNGRQGASLTDNSPQHHVGCTAKLVGFFKNNFWLFFYGVSFLLTGYVLFYTISRGAIIGAVCGLIIFFLALIFRQRKLASRLIAVLLLLIIVGAGAGLYVYRDNPALKKNPVLSQFYRIGGRSTKVRLLSWKMALEGLSARPVLGQGWSSWYVLFDRYFKPQHLTYTETWMDKPHNMPLEILVTTGILGLLGYLAVFYSALKKLWRSWRSKLKVHSAALIALLVAYFVQNLFVFDTPVSWIMFFLILALIKTQTDAEIYADDRRKDDSRFFLQPRNENSSLALYPVWYQGYLVTFKSWLTDNSPQHHVGCTARLMNFLERFVSKVKGQKSKVKSYWLRVTGYGLQFGIYLLLVLIPFSFYFYNLKPLWAAQEMKEGVGYSQRAEFNPERVYKHYKAAFEKETFVNYNAVIELGNFIMRNFSQVGLGGLDPFIDLEIDQLKAQIEKHPYNLKLKLLLARMYNYKAYKEESYVAKAEDILDKAQELAPKRPEVWFEKGFVNLKQKNFDKALEYYREGVDLNPTSGDSWWQLTVAYHRAGKNEDAAKAFAKAVKKGFAWNKKSHLLTIVNIFAKLEDYQKASKYYKYLVKKAPESPQYRISYALALAKIGNYKKAIKQMEKAIELDPEVAKQGGRDYIEEWKGNL